ncbi:general substrate transporter [Xylogone sp. PMI_703]|nr:general substrate transporter [Xylogone sp. PMI_703]
MLELRGRPLWAVTTIATSSAFLLFGYDNGVLGGLVNTQPFLDAMQHPSSNMLGLIVAIYNIGCLIGCGIAAVLGFRLGRKKTLMVGCVIVMIGAAIQASSHSKGQMIVGRIITGTGTGLITSTVPTYLSECSLARSRGQLVTTQLTIVASGITLAYWLDYGTIKHNKGQFIWRFPIAFQIIFPFISLVAITFVPETPRWLYAHGHLEAADDVLRRYRGFTIDSPEFQLEKNGILDAIKLEKTTSQMSWRDLIYDKSELKNVRRILMGIGLQGIQQLSGINLIVYYATTLFTQTVGLDLNTASLLGGVNGIIYMVTGMVVIMLVDRIGRRPMLLFGSAGMSATMICFTVLVALGGKNNGWGAVAMVFAFNTFFGLGWFSLPWLIPAEMTPLRLRHIGTATSVGSEWLFTFIIVYVAPTAITNIGWRTYLIFSIFCVLQLPFVYFLFPETKGKTLEEMDLIFSNWSYGKVKNTGGLDLEINATTLHEKAIESSEVENNGLELKN